MRALEIRRLAAVAAMVALGGGLWSGCGPAPVGDLYYVWPGADCPAHVKGLNVSKPAGFTSRRVAYRVAAAETVGIRTYPDVEIGEIRKELKTLTPSNSHNVHARGTLDAQIARLEKEKRSLRNCSRIVVKGVPDPPS